ncbi:MAG: hypothetical protein A2V66_07215 [Ignavibacteria bacterium RBG_13_36_8]|nr:MAG: hypothetical protein A2V66_07215 [Ignavibacteria bacterium RBG_13_36_8]
MVNPLSKFVAKANPFGCEIDLNWLLPESLPENYKVYIFQRSKTDVDQEQDIERYFENIDNLTNYNYNGLYVIDWLEPAMTALGIYQVKNGLKYYYKAVIRDEDSGDYSESSNANATPDFAVLVNILDGKDMVAKISKKMLDTLSTKEGTKIQLSKEFEVEKTFPMGEIKGDRIIVERVNGSNNQRFWGDIYTKHSTGIVHGDYDVDVIRLTYLTIAGNERRDLLSNIVRSRKYFYRLGLKKLGAIDVNITIEGDYHRPDIHGENCVGFTAVFAVLLEVMNKIEQEKITEHIVNEMKVNTNE